MKNYKKDDFDFSKKFVRYKGGVLTAFDIGLILNDLQPLTCWRIIYDVFKYSELVSYLKSALHYE